MYVLDMMIMYKMDKLSKLTVIHFKWLELLGMAYEVLNDAIFDLKCRLYFEEFFGE
jgi:hypothetical protein